MVAREMHYDFKKKFNKIDSSQNKNFNVTEIDWTLNEAMLLFIKIVAEPRYGKLHGFESSQRTIDDLRTLVTTTPINTSGTNIVVLPDDYLNFVKGQVLMDKTPCEDVVGTLKIRQHDDDFEVSPFDKSSFEWREVNAVFDETGIRLFTDGTFTVTQVNLTYIKQPAFIHNAQDFRTGTYTTLDGTVLTGSQDCELPISTHPEIVDLAVLLARGEIQSDFQTKISKLNLINLK